LKKIVQFKSGASVFLGAQSEYRAVLTRVARHLQTKCGARVHLYCATSQEKDFYSRRHGNCFTSITVDKALYAGCREPVGDANVEFIAARRNEAELGVTYNRLAMCDKHPRSHLSQDTQYSQVVQGLNRAVAFWRHEFAEKQPDLLINCGKIAAVIARQERIPYRALAASRYRNLHYWAVNELLESPALLPAFQSLTAGVSRDIAEPYATHLQSRHQLKREHTLVGTAKSICKISAQHVYWRLRGYEKARGYFLQENIGYLWRCYRDRVRMSGSTNLRLADLEGQPFVFFPLHTEPETSLQMLSPEYFYQLAAIAALSRDMPAGVILAVKEHYAALGRRPSDFYAQIREFKNVVMLDIDEIGLLCARKADATATITGTSGFEAAVMGRPVISFGRHNIYDFLSHVMVVEDENQLAGYLWRIFSGDIDSKRARDDGLRFLQAIVDVSFDLGEFNVTRSDEITEEAGATAYEALVASCDEIEMTNYQRMSS
jgi:hypothetical protein